MKRPPTRHLLFLFQQGYSLVNLPLGLFSFATTTYYLAVKNIPELQGVFPGFSEFLVFGAVVGGPLIALLGYSYSRSRWYTAGMENSAEVNPYNTVKFPRNSIPYHQLALMQMERMPGFPAELIAAQRRFVEESGK